MGCAQVRDRDFKINVLLLGLDQSGKSTLAYNLGDVEELESYEPTKNLEIYEVEKYPARIKFYDIGGQKDLRSGWLNQLNNVDAIFYLIDIHDKDRIDEAFQELKSILDKNETKEHPIFVFFNKIDLPQVGSEETLTRRVEEVFKGKSNYHKVYSVSCLKSIRLVEAMQEVIAYFFPSCILMQPKKHSQGALL